LVCEWTYQKGSDVTEAKIRVILHTALVQKYAYVQLVVDEACRALTFLANHNRAWVF
jgi:hypothetical protein